MNSRLDLLYPYPFERLRTLLQGLEPPHGTRPVNLGIGEPQHPTPTLITDSIQANLHLLGKYPPTVGMPELRDAISHWHRKRYGVHVEAAAILPVAGTREALFAFAQAVLQPTDPGAVVLPNPFYQIYEGAAMMAGARPVYVATPSTSGFLPDWNSIPEETWRDVRLVYVCTPGNPAGAVFRRADWEVLFSLGDRYGFIIAADECYSEIYTGDPPMGALEAATSLGRGYERLVSFNSLSKRSSAPGLRSGFVAGDREIIQKFLLYRTYHGAAPSSLTQAASISAWEDEAHVEASRAKYQEKFRLARERFPDLATPAGGFFLWLPVPDDQAFARTALREAGLTLLPGSYLAREVGGVNPGEGYVRVALVAEPDVCAEALDRLARLMA